MMVHQFISCKHYVYLIHLCVNLNSSEHNSGIQAILILIYCISDNECATR